MRDRRAVDGLSIEDLEQVIIQRRREARLHGYQQTVRRKTGAHEPSSSSGTHEAGALPNRLLASLEVAAVVGLVMVLAAAMKTLATINREAAAAHTGQVFAQPTLEPTPLLRAVVLPGGHTPPTAPGGAQPNYDEVPPNLRPAVAQQFAGPVTVPTAAPQVAVRIQIPALGIDAPVVQGDGWEQLKKGVAQHIPSANPGEPGNIVLSGHNDIYGEVFRYLDRLQEGDEIILYTRTRSYTYRAANTRIVEPIEVGVMDPAPEPIVTLISCYPYLVNSKRIIVVGELVAG